MHYIVSALTLVSALLAGTFSAPAVASNSGLRVPVASDSSIELTLPAVATVKDPASLLQVFVGSADQCCNGKSAMAGAYFIAGSVLTFDPAFDLMEGQQYTIRTYPALNINTGVEPKIGDKKPTHTLPVAAHSAPILTEFSIAPTTDAAGPTVEAVYPSGPTLPENTLRFYIDFSTPMQPHLSSRFIRLVDDEGNTDTAAFMSFKQELWSPDRKRLTLLLDPGRIKRGVTQNLTLGPALRLQQRYSLVIDAGWPAAHGNRYTSRFEKTFSVSRGLRTLPSPNQWSLLPPGVQSREPLVISFDRAFDYQLLHSGISVHDELGRVIAGTVSVDNHQTRWRFTPQQPWPDKQIQITVDAFLEDIAGNNFRELLDHPVTSKPLEIVQHVVPVALRPAINSK